MSFATFLLVGALAWSGAVEIASGRGERGPWQQNESRYDYVDDPAVALDTAGTAYVAWVDQGKKDVFLRRVEANGAALGEPVNVSRSPASFSWLPRVALGPDRTVHVLWQEILFTGGSHGGDMLIARSRDGGATFDAPINLSGGSRGGDGKGRVTRESWHNGSYDLLAAGPRVYVAWTEYDGPLWLASSADGGRSFTKPRHLFGDDRSPTRGPSLALGSDGTLHLAWTVGDDDAADIHVARSIDAGATWTEPAIVARTPAYSDSPKLAMDDAGTLHVAWADGERILHSRSRDGRSFAAPQEVGRGRFPALATSGRGDIHVAWERYPPASLRSRGLSHAHSSDGGQTFSAPVTVPGSIDPAGGANGSFQGLLMRKLAVAPGGDIAIVNSSLVDGAKSRVWLLRARSPRPPSWGASRRWRW